MCDQQASLSRHPMCSLSKKMCHYFFVPVCRLPNKDPASLFEKCDGLLVPGVSTHHARPATFVSTYVES